MKVSQVMQKEVDSVAPDTSLLEVAKIIFGQGINGVPVTDKKKVIGFITEHDILSCFFPTIDDYIADPVHSSDFEEMEKKVEDILNLPASRIMSKNPTTIHEDTPILEAQSIMMVKKIGRLPVVDKNGNLLAILAKGDIFRAVVGDKLPIEADEQFHDWLSRNYDLIIDWKKRLSKEIPDLIKLFKKQKAERILDVGCGIGLHSIELAKAGYTVVGLDRSIRMIRTAQEKLKQQPVAIQKRVQFINHDYLNFKKAFNTPFDAVIFMGTGLAHEPDPKKTLKEVNSVLTKKATIVIQLANFKKVIKENKRLFDFNIRTDAQKKEHAFLRFYDPVKKGSYTLNVSAFDRGDRRWSFHGMNAVSVKPLDKTSVTKLLTKLSFRSLSFYGGEQGFYYDSLTKKEYFQTKSDVMVVVATR